MAKFIRTIAPVDAMSGMFGKREHSMSGKAIIANIRKRGGQKHDGASFMYFSVLTKSTYGEGTEKQKANQAKFTSVSASVRERMLDPTKMQPDQQAFKAQSKYKTFYSFIWAMEWAAYEA